MDKFSERLVALRKEKDLTQAEFARLCGKQRTTVSGYETEGKEPDFALLCQMADYFIRTNRITISAGASGLLLSFCSAAVSGIMPQKASFSKTFCHKLPDFT